MPNRNKECVIIKNISDGDFCCYCSRKKAPSYKFQKQHFTSALRKKCSAFATLLKSHFGMGVLL